jgi:threonine synthase
MEMVCSECDVLVQAGGIVCRSCGGLLAFGAPAALDDASRFRDLIAARRSSSAPADRSGVWRFRELLPAIAPDAIVTLRENDVPLYEARDGGRYAGIDRLAYLHLGMNPTGSFKDAGMTVAISAARARGAGAVVCASTGNTAASMSAYAARAGMAAIVLVPATGISEAKVAQTLDYGAQVIAIDGDFDAALAVVRALEGDRVAIVNSINPYRIEGQKCAAFAILENRDWRVPDWVVLPGGNLGNTSAIGKGFREALALGLIDRLPRLAVVQASGAAPFVRALAEDADLVPVAAATAATAIKIGNPASWKKARREVALSEGLALAVDDDAIAEAKATIGRDGVGCEPASAASLAGARVLAANGTIERDDDVVLVITGHVLKDTAYAAAYHASGATLANAIVRASDRDDVLRRIDEATRAHV